MTLSSHVPLAVTTRGGSVESIHYGSLAVVDRDGKLICGVGDSEALVFTRSALKPFQAIPFVAGRGPEHFGFSQPELALICASHSGEETHVTGVVSILEKIGCAIEDLQCGSQVPLHFNATGEFVPAGAAFNALHHNCSGKHAGMLAYCRQHGHPISNYLDSDHPLQRVIRDAVSALFGISPAHLAMGIDGCSAPNYAVPIRSIAWGFARLMGTDGLYDDAPSRIAQAMSAHPYMVSGSQRMDFALMQAGDGDWFSKAGAEAVQGIGVRSRGWGIAVKVSDGAARALHPVIVSLLDQLGLLTASRRAMLARWTTPALRNNRGAQIGYIEPVFKLASP